MGRWIVLIAWGLVLAACESVEYGGPVADETILNNKECLNELAVNDEHVSNEYLLTNKKRLDGLAQGPKLFGTSYVTQQSPDNTKEVRFRPAHIYLNVIEPVAAYQVELLVLSGTSEIVGVEGGDADGFTSPPYYDPKALAGGRIILAAFNTKQVMTAGRHRVATVHLQETGPAPVYHLKLVVAGNAAGDAVAAAPEIVF